MKEGRQAPRHALAFGYERLGMTNIQGRTFPDLPARIAAQREPQGRADFIQACGTELGHAFPQPLLRHGDRIVQVYRAGAFIPFSSFKTTSDGTPRMVEVTGATVTVDK